jgi:hypothetical protein
MKRTIVTLVTLLLIFFSAVVLLSEKTNYVLAQIEIKGEAVEYELPFAGVLPDSPLYYLKTVRDNFWLFFKRDNMKKAEVLILFSDKKTAAAQMLTKKGKWEAGGEIMLGAEQNFKRMVDMVILSKNQGVGADEQFILKMKQSNKKHREVIEDLLESAPDGSRKQLEEALKLNIQLSDKLNESF